MSKQITTPTGLKLTVAQYVDTASNWPYPCKHGHLNCAAWAKGPCVDELLTEQESKNDTTTITVGRVTRLEDQTDAAGAMLAALKSSQEMVERSAEVYADRMATDGTSHAAENWGKALKIVKQVQAAIAAAEAAGIK